MQFYSQNSSEVLDKLKSSKNGLDDKTVAERSSLGQKNKLEDAKKQSLASKFFAQFKDVMVIILLVSAVIGALPYAAGAVEAPLALLNGVLFGIFAALYLIRRGNIWGIGAFHAAWSFVRDIVFGTPDQVATAVVLLVGMILVGGKRPWGKAESCC